MKKNLVVSLAIIAAGNIALAGMKKCGSEDVKVNDPRNFVERMQRSVLETIPQKTLETIAGSNTYQGIGYEINGTGKCIVDSRDGQDDMSQFARRDQRSLNCVIEGATAVPFIITDRVVDIVTGTITTVGDLFTIDGTDAARFGIDMASMGLNKNNEKLKKRERNSFGNFMGAAGNGFIALFSGLFGTGSNAVGMLLNAIAARIDVIYNIPKDIIQHSLRTGEQLFELNPENAAKSFGQVMWRAVSAVPSFVLGCEPLLEPTPNCSAANLSADDANYCAGQWQGY
jgi:hypothetical protein